MANMPLQDSWTLHYSERSSARARAQAFEEQVSGVGRWLVVSRCPASGQCPSTSTSAAAHTHTQHSTALSRSTPWRAEITTFPFWKNPLLPTGQAA